MTVPPHHSGPWLSFHSGAHDRRRIADAEAQRARQLEHARRRIDIVRSAALVDLKMTLRPDDAVTERFERVLEQPEYKPADGGCTRCFHRYPAHVRGRDTPRSCTSAGCDCPGFREGWTAWRVLATAVMCLFWFAVAAGVVLLVASAVVARHG